VVSLLWRFWEASEWSHLCLVRRLSHSLSNIWTAWCWLKVLSFPFWLWLILASWLYFYIATIFFFEMGFVLPLLL
jgi:hypothetical protein